MPRSPQAQANASLRNQFRIIAGSWRGRRLTFAAGTDARPTGDRVRETLFNWLAPCIEGARCLDLFAGSGALGFEALSRQAKEVIFVDTDRRLTDAISANLTRLGCDRGQVVRQDAVRWLGQSQVRADLVFLDPPFRAQLPGKLCKLLDEHKTIPAGGHCYIEMAAGQPEFDLPAGWQVLKQKRFGKVIVKLIQITMDITDKDTPGA